MEEQPETIINNDDLFRILKLMEESHWDEIEIVTKNFKFRVGKNLPNDYNSTLSPAFSQPLSREDKPHLIVDSISDMAEVSSGNQAKAKSSDISKVNAEVNGKTIYAPMMGMFYRAPSPAAPPFVEVGDTVTEHTIIGIIEVMKVMSSIEAGVKGKVSSILVENGQLVEYNQPLLLIDPGE